MAPGGADGGGPELESRHPLREVGIGAVLTCPWKLHVSGVVCVLKSSKMHSPEK